VALPSVGVLLTDQSLNDNFDRVAKSSGTELALDPFRIRRLSLMVVYYEDEDVKAEKEPKKVYMIINGKKLYINPQFVKKV
jgi:cytochrome b involved in lipid metabolism